MKQRYLAAALLALRTVARPLWPVLLIVLPGSGQLRFGSSSRAHKARSASKLPSRAIVRITLAIAKPSSHGSSRVSSLD